MQPAQGVRPALSRQGRNSGHHRNCFDSGTAERDVSVRSRSIPAPALPPFLGPRAVARGVDSPNAPTEFRRYREPKFGGNDLASIVLPATSSSFLSPAVPLNFCLRPLSQIILCKKTDLDRIHDLVDRLPFYRAVRPTYGLLRASIIIRSRRGRYFTGRLNRFSLPGAFA